MCRDGVYASTLITKMIKDQGSLEELVSGFKTYFQDRAKIDLPRELGPKILEVLSGSEGDVDVTDGVKIRKSDKSWVLIRASNTENVMRISAEAKSSEKARELVREYLVQDQRDRQKPICHMGILDEINSRGQRRSIQHIRN